MLQLRKIGQGYPARARRILQRSAPFDGREAILTEDGERVRFNLQILFQMLAHAERETNPATETRTVANVRTEYSSSRVLTYYLRRAKAVLALYHRIADDENAADVIDLRHQGNALAWRDFLFDNENLARLARAVAVDRTLPRAVDFELERHYPISEDKPRWLITGPSTEVEHISPASLIAT